MNSIKSIKYVSLNADEIRSLLGWTTTQGHILTGDGSLEKLTTKGIDFEESDLPYYLLSNRITRKMFSKWLAENKRSYAIVGCWQRPLFSGGWLESTSADSVAMNLQTPSLFIDMRFPLLRPTNELKERKRKSLSQCTDVELRMLARQHCFAGYSYPEDRGQSDINGPPVFTRHHIIDWNYHPRYPRSRPNRWWIELSSDEQSFKEFSFARDSNNVPVYFERWARIAGDSNGSKYLACRRKTECPVKLSAQGRPFQRDAVLIVVGNHFATAVDRCQPVPYFAEYAGPGGGPAVLVDASVSALDIVTPSSDSLERQEAEQLLDLVGSYGYVFDETNVPSWTIVKSTHPWLEGDNLYATCTGTGKNVVQLTWASSISPLPIQSIHWDGFEWEVLECSFTKKEIIEMFSPYTTSHSKL